MKVLAHWNHADMALFITVYVLLGLVCLFLFLVIVGACGVYMLKRYRRYKREKAEIPDFVLGRPTLQVWGLAFVAFVGYLHL